MLVHHNTKPKQLKGKLLIGLTGGIGSGKTTVTDLFAEQGIQVIDTDVIARKALELNSPLLNKVLEKFGSKLQLEDGNLNRSALREIVFNQPASKTWLEELIHPWVREQSLIQLIEASSPYVILSSPLLIESQQHLWVDRLLIVNLPKHLQIERVTKRDSSSANLVEKIINQQLNSTQRLALADDVIENTQGLDFLEKQVISLHNSYLKLAQQK